jgi:N-acetylglucosamine-6-phosphate deacetylase
MSGWFTLFTNCRYILNGELVEDHLVISDETGLILKREGYIGGEAIDLEDSIIAPGYLELHTNGANGFHFTHYEDEKTYATKIDDIARYYATQGVTGFWATLPTVKSDEFQKVRQMECSSNNSAMMKCNTPCKVADTPPDSSLFEATPDSLVSISSRGSYRRPIPTPH